MATNELTLSSLKKKIEVHRETGGLIFIKHTDENGNPMNFRINGTKATSGVWRVGLTGKPIDWVLVFQAIDKESALVWTGNYVKSNRLNLGYEIVLENLIGPLKTNMSLSELTEKSHPQNPVFLSLQKPTLKQSEVGLVNDILKLLGDAPPGTLKTEKEQLILARLGQGKFRQQVLDLWGGACAVTGIKTVEAIRASHIIPWKRCSRHKTRLNPENGLPLVATLDSLFDRGLISFDADGAMLVSSKVPDTEWEILGIPTDMTRKPSKQQRVFLDFHRSTVFMP